jgi:hypothetical protein
MADEDRVKLTEEEKEDLAKEWEEYVRNEVNALLDIYLPDAIAGNVGIKYANPVIESYEDGTKKTDEDSAVGVNIHINFRFKGQIEIPKEDK